MKMKIHLGLGLRRGEAIVFPSPPQSAKQNISGYW